MTARPADATLFHALHKGPEILILANAWDAGSARLMEREAQPNRWEDWRFTVKDVVASEAAFGAGRRILRDDGKSQLALHPGFTLELFRDEAEGYYLNLSSGAPVWFVMSTASPRTWSSRMAR